MIGINTIGFGILILLIVLVVVDTIQLYRLRKIVKEYQVKEQLSLDKFHELKWRLILLTSIVGISSIILTYLGFSIHADLQTKYQTYNKKATELDSLISVQNQQLLELDSLKNSLFERYSDLKESVSTVAHEVKVVQSENLRQSQVYIVTSLKLDLGTTNSQRFWYKDLITNTGSKLPQFNKEPIVSIINNEKGPANLFIYKNSKDYFEVSKDNFWAIGGDFVNRQKQDEAVFDVWISNQ